MAAIWAWIGARAGEPGLARARAAWSSRLARSSSGDVSVLTSRGRPESGISEPGAVVLLGDHLVDGGLQVGPCRRDGGLLVEERDGGSSWRR
jgi:hypothetical protein